MYRKVSLLLVSCVLTVSFLAACAGAPAPAPTPTTAPAAQPQQPVAEGARRFVVVPAELAAEAEPALLLLSETVLFRLLALALMRRCC